MSTTKVVFLCHFSNSRVREKMRLSKKKHNDFASWITLLIEDFKNLPDVELHVISPHAGMLSITQNFKLDNVHYHFFSATLQEYLYKLPFSKKKEDRRYKLNRYLIKRIIDKINPGIINLIGSENPQYSSAVLDLKTYPVHLSVQTVYTNPLRATHGKVDKGRWNTELEIHKKIKYFGCGGRMYHDLIKNNNPNAVIFKYFFPYKKPTIVKQGEDSHDFVFFAAQVTNKKGIEDAIRALSIVKKIKNDVSLNILGKCDADYKQELNQLIDSLSLKDNIHFNGYFPTQEQMHQQACKSRFAVLPVKMDVISSTIIESIYMGLPVVTYKTTGTPYLNRDGEAVLICNIGDIDILAQNMARLLTNPELGTLLKQNACSFIIQEFDNKVSATRLLENFKAVISHHNHKMPVPEDLLLNLEEFPIYI